MDRRVTMPQAKKQGGKKQRKFGRNARRPAQKRRKLRRPELLRKARNVLQSSGKAALLKWADFRAGPRVFKDGVLLGYGDNAVDVRKARDNAITARKHRQ